MRKLVPLWVKLTPTIVMLLGFVDRLEQLYPRTRRSPARFVAQFRGALPLRAQQMVFRRALRPHLRPPGAVARPPVLEAAATRGRSTASAPTAPPLRSASATGVTARLQSGYLYTYALVMLLGLIGAATWAIGGLDEPGFPILTHPDRRAAVRGASPACSSSANGARWIALIATLIDLALGIVLWAAYDPGGAQWQFVENHAAWRRRSAGRSASTASP